MLHIPTIPQRLLIALGESLSIARKQRHWRQDDLAERIGVTRQTVAKMEHGDAKVAAGIYFTAAWLLHVPFIPGIDMAETEAEDALASFIKLLKKQTPKRITRKAEKPVDDNF